MQARAGRLGELHIAGDANRFRRRGHPAQAQARGSHALTHDRPGSQGNVFGMLHHRKIERAAIIHDLAGEPGGRNRPAIIGNTHDARVFHARNFGDRFALAPHGGRANRPHSNAAGDPGAIHNEARDGSIVIDRLGIRHAANRGEPSTRRRPRACFDSLRGFLSRLAQVHVDIDKARSDDQSAGVKKLRALRREEFPGRSKLGYFLPIQQHVENSVGLRGRVEDAPVLNQKHGASLGARDACPFPSRR